MERDKFEVASDTPLTATIISASSIDPPSQPRYALASLINFVWRENWAWPTQKYCRTRCHHHLSHVKHTSGAGRRRRQPSRKKTAALYTSLNWNRLWLPTVIRLRLVGWLNAFDTWGSVPRVQSKMSSHREIKSGSGRKIVSLKGFFKS